jgi:hypothetical protein
VKQDVELVMSGFVFNNLLFTTTERAVIIRRNDREELPHLSIFFKTASGEMDGHLKNELPAPGTEVYTPLFRFPAAKLGNFATEFARTFEPEFRNLYSTLKRATPAWLRRNGYVLAFSKTDALSSRISDFAPKLRGKHRVDLEKLKELFSGEASQVTLLDPSALKSNELKNHNSPIFAVRRRGKNRSLGLVYAPSRYGERVWLITNPFGALMPNILAKLLPPHITQKGKDVWHQIYEALQLAELGIARD